MNEKKLSTQSGRQLIAEISLQTIDATAGDGAGENDLLCPSPSQEFLGTGYVALCMFDFGNNTNNLLVEHRGEIGGKDRAVKSGILYQSH